MFLEQLLKYPSSDKELWYKYLWSPCQHDDDPLFLFCNFQRSSNFYIQPTRFLYPTCQYSIIFCNIFHNIFIISNPLGSFIQHVNRQLEELIEEECQARKDDFQVLLPSTITSQTWNVIHDHNVNIFRSTFCQSFVVSMETEIHERIINDRRTMVVVDDDRWVHHSPLLLEHTSAKNGK